MWAMFTHQINFTLRCICTSQCFQDEDEIYKGWTYCFILKHCSKSILSYALPILDPRKHWVCVCVHRRRETVGGREWGKGTSSHSLFLLSPWPTELPESSKHGPKMLEKSGHYLPPFLAIWFMPSTLKGPIAPAPSAQSSRLLSLKLHKLLVHRLSYSWRQALICWLPPLCGQNGWGVREIPVCNIGSNVIGSNVNAHGWRGHSSSPGHCINQTLVIIWTFPSFLIVFPAHS